MLLMRTAVCFDGWVITHDHMRPFEYCPRPPRVLFLLPPIFLFYAFYTNLAVIILSSLSLSLSLSSFLCSCPPHTCRLISLPFAPTVARGSEPAQLVHNFPALFYFHRRPTIIPFLPATPVLFLRILLITTFTTRYSPFSFTYTHRSSHFPALQLVPYPSRKYNTYNTGVQKPVKNSNIMNNLNSIKIFSNSRHKPLTCIYLHWYFMEFS